MVFLSLLTGSLTRTLQTLEAYSCEGGTLAVSCPASTVISVQYAKYGRSVPSSLMCPRGAAAPDTRSLLAGGEGEGRGAGAGADGARGAKENTNCLAVRSLEVRLPLLFPFWLAGGWLSAVAAG